MREAIALPRVCGRHRNYALAALRRERAIQLRASGMTFQAIADDLGYTSKATAFNIIKKAMTKHVAEAVEDRKLLEGSRLDVLQAALWTRAVGGDLKAAQICLAIIMDRIKLFGLDREEVNADGPRTVVVEPTVEGLESFTRD